MTSGYYHSEATYEAQTKYPEIQFVLIGGEPKENAFYSEPFTSSQTLTTQPPKELCGFLAGYSAVYEGYTSLGFFNTVGLRNISSGVGFLAGAYYAANQLNIDIVINEISYKNIDHASLLVKTLYANKAFESGVELIYTFEDDDNAILEELAVSEGVKIILAPRSYNNESESILSILETNKANTVGFILDSYFNGNFEGGQSIYEDYNMDFSNYSQFSEAEFTRIKEIISEGSITVPNDYNSLLVFLNLLEIAVPVYFDEWLIEGMHSVEDLVQ